MVPSTAIVVREPQSLECITALPVDAVLIEPPPAAKPGSPSPLNIKALLAPPAAAAPLPVRLAVVCMTKRPLSFRTWLEYFHTAVGVSRFYIRVEDTPELRELFREDPWASLVEASFHEGEGLVRDNGSQQTERQDRHVKRAIEAARRDECTHLLHCDDDELLFLPSGLAAFRRELEQSSASYARGNGGGYTSFHALTIEATYPRVLAGHDVGGAGGAEDPFRAAVAFRHRPADYSSYGGLSCSTGKAIGVLGSPHGLKPDGPHHFGPEHARGAARTAALGDLRHTRILPPRLAVLLHFESASVPRWKAKFADAARVARRRDDSTANWIDEQGFDDEELARVRAAVCGGGGRRRRDGDPAPSRDGHVTFYSASSEMADRLHAAAASGDAAAKHAAEAAALALWRTWKLTPAELPQLGAGERYRVLPEHGFTLIDVFAPEGRCGMDLLPVSEGQRQRLLRLNEGGGERGNSTGAASQRVVGSDHDECASLRELLDSAKVPLAFAAPLAAAVAADALGLGEFVRGTAERQRLERILKRAALPLGHRLRLVNALYSTSASGAGRPRAPSTRSMGAFHLSQSHRSP
jgi:hypothetical protein